MESKEKYFANIMSLPFMYFEDQNLLKQGKKHGVLSGMLKESCFMIELSLEIINKLTFLELCSRLGFIFGKITRFTAAKN